MDIKIDLKNYNLNNPIFKRTAARGIVKKNDKYLLIYSKFGDYKFPGGGVDEGETLEAAVIREVQEETGYYVIKDSIKEYGTVFERRVGGPTITSSHPTDVIEMNSYYYFCEVKDEVGERNLDDYEEEYDYQIVWMTLEEAIIKNEQVSDLDSYPWVIRETKVMKSLLSRKVN